MIFTCNLDAFSNCLKTNFYFKTKEHGNLEDEFHPCVQIYNNKLHKSFSSYSNIVKRSIYFFSI